MDAERPQDAGGVRPVRAEQAPRPGELELVVAGLRGPSSPSSASEP